jgi:hypothetical protein
VTISALMLTGDHSGGGAAVVTGCSAGVGSTGAGAVHDAARQAATTAVRPNRV